MQVKDKRAKFWLNILKVAILILCLAFIGGALYDQPVADLHLVFDQWPVVLVVASLAPVNWYLEVLRWKHSLSQLGPVTFMEASRQVFTGLAMNWVAPFTSGDLLVKLHRASNKRHTTAIILLNRLIMIVFTVILGMYGVYRFSTELFQSQIGWWLVVAVGILIVWGLLRRFLFKKILILTRGAVLHIISLSLVRYAVFTLQFAWLLSAFNPQLPYDIVLAGVGWIFLFRSFIPSLFGNFGVREASALVFFQSLVHKPMLILMPSLTIWFINTVLPSLLGLYFLFKFRVKLAE